MSYRKTGKHYYIARIDDGGLWCKDGRTRTFATFGTFRSCVKVWQTQPGWVQRKMRDLNQACIDRNQEPRYMVVTLSKGQFLDACGKIFQTNEDGSQERIIGELGKVEVVDFQAIIPEVKVV